MSLLKIHYLIIILLISAIITVLIQPLIHENKEAVDVIITVYSIMSGFLIGIITIIGDPLFISGGSSWRYSEIARIKIKSRLTQQKWLFIAYLITLVLIFFSRLVYKVLPEIVMWIEYVYVFLSVLAFIFSLTLPSTIMRIQMERVDLMIEQRKEEDKKKQ